MTTTTAPRSTSSTMRAVTPVGTFAVGTASLDIVDPTVSPGTPSRQLPTQVWFPATTPSSPVPDTAHAPYPLLVFSQGFATGVAAYSPLLDAWASAGFVVAAPTYPDTDPTSPTLDEADIVNHPADLRAVITTVVRDATGPGTPLSGAVATDEIGLVGQSDGGDVTLAVGDNSADRYPDIKAVAVLSGAELASFGGSYFTPHSTPLLVVQGDADTINPPGCSAQIYDAALAPKYYLDLLGAPHVSPYTTADGYEAVVAQVTTDFFEGELATKPAALDAMPAAGDVSGTATFIAGGTAPPAATPACPGAP
ncbi:MAG: alpha/beta hydrolase family protein [Acidimicrobiales bacterium]